MESKILTVNPLQEQQNREIRSSKNPKTLSLSHSISLLKKCSDYRAHIVNKLYRWIPESITFSQIWVLQVSRRFLVDCEASQMLVAGVRLVGFGSLKYAAFKSAMWAERFVLSVFLPSLLIFANFADQCVKGVIDSHPGLGRRLNKGHAVLFRHLQDKI